MGAHGPYRGLEQDRIDRGFEIVVGNKLYDASAAFRHLGALRRFGNAAQMAAGHDFHDIPFGVGVESFFNVGRIQQLQYLLQVMPGFHRQRENIAVG